MRVWVLLVIMGAFALRVHHLAQTPLRGDEAFSAQYWAQLPLSESLTTIATIEPHPPLTYVIFHLWGRVFGIYSEFALRLLPALANTLGVALLYQLGRRLGNTRTGIIAALLWAIHPFEVWHAQDFRNYAIWASSSAALGYLALRYWHAPSPTKLWHYGIWAIVSALIFYFELFIIGAFAMAGLLYLPLRHRRQIGAWLAMNALACGAVLGVFLMLQGQLFGSGGYAGNTSAFSPQEWVTIFMPVLAFGDTLPFVWFAPLGILLTSLYILIVLGIKPRKDALMLAIWAFLPLLLLGVVSSRVSVFIPRYGMAVIPSLILIIALFLANRHIKPIVRGCVALFWVVMCAFSLINYYNNIPSSKSPDWYSLRDFATENIHITDYVIQSAPESAFSYYLYQGVGEGIANAALPVSPTFPTDTEIERILSDITAGYGRVWYFLHTNWQNTRTVQAWLSERAESVQEWHVMGRVIQLYTLK